jgi:hypothetical protein
MNKSARNQDIHEAVLSLLVGQIKSSPRQNQFTRLTKEPVKLSGIGKVTVPDSVWHALLEAPELEAWTMSIEPGEGTSPEFTMNKR